MRLLSHVKFLGGLSLSELRGRLGFRKKRRKQGRKDQLGFNGKTKLRMFPAKDAIVDGIKKMLFSC